MACFWEKPDSREVTVVVYMGTESTRILKENERLITVQGVRPCRHSGTPFP